MSLASSFRSFLASHPRLTPPPAQAFQGRHAHPRGHVLIDYTGSFHQRAGRLFWQAVARVEGRRIAVLGGDVALDLMPETPVGCVIKDLHRSLDVLDDPRADLQ